MVSNPELWLDELFECKINRIIFHVEIPDQTSILLILSKIKKQYIETGLALNSSSNVLIYQIVRSQKVVKLIQFNHFLPWFIYKPRLQA